MDSETGRGVDSSAASGAAAQSVTSSTNSAVVKGVDTFGEQQLLSTIDHALQVADNTIAHAHAHAHRRARARRNVRGEPIALPKTEAQARGVESSPLTGEVRQIADRLRKKINGREAGRERAEL